MAMSSTTRNKRKRPENETAAMAPTPRRRSRDQRAASEPAPLEEEKNEGDNKIEIAKTTGEPDTKTTPTAPQSPKPETNSTIDPPEENPKTNSNSQIPGNNKGSSETPKLESKASETAVASPSIADPGSSSSQEELSVKKQALHLSESTNDATKTSNSGSDVSGNDRESRIRGLIAHRSLLLERIRLCRSVAEKRLGEVKVDKPPGEKGSKAVGAGKEMTDDAEIAAFREMTKQASQAAKKSRPDSDGTAEKRTTSLSLRRGSSVGKRMNAALSSLAPGSNASANADISSTHPMQVPNIPPAKSLSKAPQGVTIIAKSAPPQVLSTGQTLAGAVLQQQTAPPNTMIKTPSSQKIFQIPKPPIPSGQEVKIRAPNPKILRAMPNVNARPSSVTRSDPVSMPLHFGASASVLPTNRLAQTKVNFPEAVALREKRDAIQSRLKALLERQQKRDMNGAETAEELRHTPLPSTKSTKKTLSRLMELGSRPPPQLPRRRKTHWDCLLQEMRWMATDFIEERKWKMSSARTIASAIPTPGLAAVKVLASRSLETKRDFDAKLGIASDFKECKMETPDNSEEVPESPNKKSTKIVKQVEQRQYIMPSMEDSKDARKVGRIVSAMISELGSATTDAGSMGLTDEPHTEALERYLQNRSKIMNERTGDSVSSQQDSKDYGEASHKIEETESDVKGAIELVREDSNEENMDETTEDPTFESITEQVDKLYKFNGRSRSKSSAKEMTNALEVEKLNLSAEQKDTVDFVEKLWGGNPSAGAVLIGPAASGKTLATCSLLWKQKSKGPQMVVCPPTSVVSSSPLIEFI
jgi:hypothetical protein